MSTPGLLRRLASMGYEAVLLFAVAFFATWVFFFVSGGQDATAGRLRYVLQLFIFTVIAAYFLWCWLRGGQTLAMKAEEQERVQRRMQRWAALSPEQRRQARETYKQIVKVPPEQRGNLRDHWAEYQALSPREREDIAPEHRRKK